MSENTTIVQPEVRIGTHVLGNLRGCPVSKLERVQEVRALLRSVADRAGFKIVGESFHQFQPVGVTGVLVLQESHMSIHTWPELGLAAADVFTCGAEGNAEVGFQCLVDAFDPAEVERRVVGR